MKRYLKIGVIFMMASLLSTAALAADKIIIGLITKTNTNPFKL